MKVKTIYKVINLDNKWTKVNLGNFKDFYLIGLKKSVKKLKKNMIDANEVTKIRFEIGVASGVKGKPLTINYITMNFNDVSSSDVDTNKITALSKHTNFPSTFYIKPVEIWCGNDNTSEGKTKISATINALKLV